MKTFRYVTAETQIDISMPSWLFWFFKRLSKIKTSPHTPGLKGREFDLVCIDEASEV
jgi:hypothetical protein